MRRCISDNVVKTRISFTLTPRFELDHEKMKQNYLQRYPFILNERYANVCNIIEHSYNINCAPRKSSPVSMATALAISYRKGTKSRSGSSGPTRYKIENQFQSRFCR